MSDTVTVVVAEDEAIIRLDLVETLRGEGYDVVADTGRGDEAVDLVTAHQPDVAVLDVKMPGLDGIEAAGRITELGGTAVVLLTAFSQRELVERAAAAGAMAYLVKPYQRADLVPAIETALARFREHHELQGQVGDLAEKLEVRKLVDRAKGRLIDDHGLSEGAAFRFLQTTAMAKRRTMAAVAEDVLRGNLVP
ncbi:MAG: response regulator [Acidimicrobiales bacterium]|nr:response regulator [Acidimicrobiales bacterium]